MHAMIRLRCIASSEVLESPLILQLIGAELAYSKVIFRSTTRA
jgi:hypothetical protein